MTLLPKEDILQREIESWNKFADTLRKEDRELFRKMLKECYQYHEAVNAKGQPFASESLLMALILAQYKLIGRFPYKKRNSL